MRRSLPWLALAILCGCTVTQTSERKVNVTLPLPQITGEGAQVARDAMLNAMVRGQIAATDVDSLTRVSVRTHDGIVRLGGSVRSETARTKIEKAVRGLTGVKSVVDEIAVNPNAKNFAGGDFVLAARIDAALAGQIGVNAVKLRVSTQDGTATLKGRLPTNAIKETALDTVRKIDGVKRVVDNIDVGR